jgi:hypothetical protein
MQNTGACSKICRSMRRACEAVVSNRGLPGICETALIAGDAEYCPELILDL